MYPATQSTRTKLVGQPGGGSSAAFGGSGVKGQTATSYSPKGVSQANQAGKLFLAAQQNN